jgi:hypothetical protein
LRDVAAVLRRLVRIPRSIERSRSIRSPQPGRAPFCRRRTLFCVPVPFTRSPSLRGGAVARTGFGTFDQAFPAYQDGSLSGIFDRTHNDYLEAAFELGIPAAAFLIAAIFYLGVQCCLGVLRRRRNAAYPALGAAATALVAVHSLADFSLQMPAVTATFAFLLGLGYAQS